MESLLSDLWKRALGPWLDVFWASVTLWRALTLVLVTAFVIMCVWRRKLAEWLAPQKRLDHDGAIFRNSSKQMDEAHLRALIQDLRDGHAYTKREADAIKRFFHFFELTGNQFIDRPIKKACLTLTESLRRLMGFIAINFFVYPRSQTSNDFRYRMHPGLNSDLDGTGAADEMAKYAKYERELYALLDATSDSYARYRSLVKSRLKL